MIQIPNVEPNANKSFYQLSDSQSCLNIVQLALLLSVPFLFSRLTLWSIHDKDKNKIDIGMDGEWSLKDVKKGILT